MAEALSAHWVGRERERERGVDGMRGPASCERARRRHGQLPSCADLPHRGPAPHRMGVWRRLGRVATRKGRSGRSVGRVGPSVDPSVNSTQALSE
jgi:hypothetical protein